MRYRFICNGRVFNTFNSEHEARNCALFYKQIYGNTFAMFIEYPGGLLEQI